MHKSTPSARTKEILLRIIITFAKYFAGFSAHLRIVKRAYSNKPDVSFLIAFPKTADQLVEYCK